MAAASFRLSVSAVTSAVVKASGSVCMTIKALMANTKVANTIDILRAQRKYMLNCTQ